MAKIYADVYDAAGNLLGPGPLTNIKAASVTRVLDGPGQISLDVPLADPRVQDLVSSERRVVLYTADPGIASGINTLTAREVGRGIIREIKGSNTAALQTLGGPDQLDELRRKNTLLARKYDGVLCADVVDDLIGLVSGWAATTTNTPANGLFARFDGASVLKAIQEIAKQQGLHFRWNADHSISFGPLGDAAPIRVIQTGHRLMRTLELNDAVALIDTLTWLDDSNEIVNWVIPVGGGQGEAALTLQHCTRGVDRVDWLTGYSDSFRDSFQTLQGLGVQNGEKLAMQFTLAAAGYIKSALLLLKKYGAPTGTDTIRIETNSSDAPSGTLADANLTTTLAEADLSATSWVMEAATFATGATLAAGTYWLVLSTSRSYSATNYVRWGTDKSSPAYTGGQVKRWNGSAWVAPTNVRDACFAIRTLVESRITDVIAEYLDTNLDSWVSLQRTVVSIGSELSYAGCTYSQSTSSDGSHTFSKAFDNSAATNWSTSSGHPTGWGTVSFTGNVTVGQYAIQAASNPARCPKNWELQIWSGGTFVTVDTQADETDWTAGEIRTFTLATPATATAWQLLITANNGDANFVAVAELDLYAATVETHTKLAQSFVGDGGRIATVKLPLIRKGTPAGDLTVRIQTDSGSSPSGTTITDGTSGTVAASGLPVAPTDKAAFAFSTPPVGADGTTYWIVLETTDGESATDFVLWGADGSSPGYADGQLKGYNAAWAAESKDGIFQVLAACVVEPYAVQTLTGPDGRTLYYLADAASIATYGQIEKIFTADITPLSMSATDLKNAANALYDAACAKLSRFAAVQNVYGLTLKKAYANLLPGQLIHVSYQGYVTDLDGTPVSWRSVDEAFWIVKVTENLATGETSLEISNIDRAKEDLAALIVGSMEAVSLKNVQVQPYPTIYPYSGQDTVGSAYTYDRSAGFGNTVFGKAATFEITVPNFILSITKAVLRLQTRPLGLSAFVNAVAGTNAEYIYAYSPLEDANYPAYITAVLDDGNVGDGPWLTSDENEPLDLEIDVTALVSDDGAPRYGNHTLTVTCGNRTTGGGDDHAVAGFTPWVHVGTHGIVMVNLAIHCVTQAMKT